MSFEEFVDKMKNIQIILLEFLEDESDAEDKYENLINLISTLNIINVQYEFKALLKLMNTISSFHQRGPNFISKNERLLRHFKKDIQKYFSNSEIFEIFKLNMRIHLFLIEEKIMTIDEYVFSQIIIDQDCIDKKYLEYFQPEIRPFLTEENIEKYGSKNKILKDDKFIEKMKKEVDKDFYEKRREGERDDYLCELIRFNKIEEFITFTEQRNLPLDSEIKSSIFETNLLLDDEYEIKLIEYASFYGSNDVIKYLQMKGVKFTSFMWIYAIHSKNAELIQYLENNHVSQPDDIIEIPVMCHHNEILNYIIDNLIKEEDLQDDIECVFQNAIEYHNYCFFPTKKKCKNMLLYLCECDDIELIKLLLEEGDIDINATIRTSII